THRRRHPRRHPERNHRRQHGRDPAHRLPVPLKERPVMAELIPLGTLTGSGSGGGPVTADNITDATSTGKEVLTGNAAAGRTALGAASASDLATLQTAFDNLDLTVAVADLDGITAVGEAVATAASQSAARSAIGAGTSNLAL